MSSAQGNTAHGGPVIRQTALFLSLDGNIFSFVTLCSCVCPQGVTTKESGTLNYRNVLSLVEIYLIIAKIWSFVFVFALIPPFVLSA